MLNIFAIEKCIYVVCVTFIRQLRATWPNQFIVSNLPCQTVSFQDGSYNK